MCSCPRQMSCQEVSRPRRAVDVKEMYQKL